MTPLQRRLAVVGLQALAARGFVLAGGYALQMHGFGTRQSDDIDLFTNDPDSIHFGESVDQVVVAYQTAGLGVAVARRAPVFARLVVDAVAKVDLGVDHRQQPPAVSEIGPVLSESDAIGSKVGAVYSRLEPRDLIDVQVVLDSRRYTTDELLALADQREANPVDREMFAGQLYAARRLPDSAFERYGASPDLIARIRRTTQRWAEQLSRPCGTMDE